MKNYNIEYNTFIKYKAIVYSASSEDITTVFSNGVKVLDDRKITYADESEIIKDVNAAWSAVTRR